MARPKKEKKLIRNRRIYLRFTNTEYENLSTNAKDANLTLAEYTRKQALNQRIKVKYEIVADLPELKQMISEFGKIGSNLNQIARYFNSGGIHSQEMRKEINQSIARIYEMKYEVLKMAGNFTAAGQENTQSPGGLSYGNTEAHSK